MLWKKHRSGIRMRITAISVLFTLLLSVTFASASFFMFRRYARASVLRSAEFNLRLVANLVEQDLIELNSLANRQSLDADTVRYLTSDGADRPAVLRNALTLYEEMTQSANLSRSYFYLQRFLVLGADGDPYTLIACRVGNFDVSLMHLMPDAAIFSHDKTLGLFIFGVVFLVSLMGIALFLYLNRLIVVPVAKLRGRIGRIAGGDFTDDPSIEWPNELGDVGRGVNQLSRDVQSLMARRVADGQERQSLECKMLQNQVNPHFIYNTLNSIRWMATLQGAVGIAEMTTAFARLLKRVSKGNRPLHTLREEFALLNDYCTVRQYRYGAPFLIDLGVETYTQKTFSPRRYEIWTMQSQWHNLPTFDGVLQQDGPEFRARDVRTAFSPDAAEISMELSAAWPKQARLDRFTRTARLTAGGLTLTDRARGGYAEAFLSLLLREKPAVDGCRVAVGNLGTIVLRGASGSIETDVLPITDARLRIAWPDTLYRLRVPFTDALTVEIH